MMDLAMYMYIYIYDLCVCVCVRVCVCVGVLMMDLATLRELETMSLNPSSFNGVYADSGSGLLYYLNSLRGPQAPPGPRGPGQSTAPHHATGQKEKGGGDRKGGVTPQGSPTKSFDPLSHSLSPPPESRRRRILEYPTARGGW
jgi:hypothetical protein